MGVLWESVVELWGFALVSGWTLSWSVELCAGESVGLCVETVRQGGGT